MSLRDEIAHRLCERLGDHWVLNSGLYRSDADAILALVGAHLGSDSGPKLSSNDPEPDTRWQHRNGNVYQVVLITNLPDEERYPKTIVYRNVSNGTYWYRRADDWHRIFVRVA